MLPINNETVRQGVLSFMSTRCAVSSQHKLPTESEILGTQFAAFIGKGRVKLAIAQLVSRGRLIEYGPYLSDRKIEVL